MVIYNNDYKKYLNRLIGDVFKVLPLYQNGNPHLIDYLDSLIEFKILGAKEYYKEYDLYILDKTGEVLNGIQKNLKENKLDFSAKNLKRVRREVLGLTHNIESYVKQL